MRNVKLPNFDFEKQLLVNNPTIYIAGVDEVGRGCLAGPVVAACVVFDSDFIRGERSVKILIRDSKKMSSIQRKKASEWIKNNCVNFSIGEASVGVINKLGITKATQMAVRQAVRKCSEKCGINYLLSDAFYIPRLPGLPKDRQQPIIKGDNLSISIAAAAILAKVYRDDIMTNLGLVHDLYGFHRNKGYGTKEHQKAILVHGPTKLHRKLFLRNLLGV